MILRPRRRSAITPVADAACWVCLADAGQPIGDVTAMCDPHALRVRRTATVQSKAGYRALAGRQDGRAAA